MLLAGKTYSHHAAMADSNIPDEFFGGHKSIILWRIGSETVLNALELKEGTYVQVKRSDGSMEKDWRVLYGTSKAHTQGALNDSCNWSVRVASDANVSKTVSFAQLQEWQEI
jgi:hypothetical protein